ncbi:MAG: thioredoxin [Myxococcota bacterium]
MTVNADDETFEELVLQAARPVLVDFWATWCAPCRAVAPVVERLAVEWAGTVDVVKVDVDASPRTAERYGIRSIPTFGVFVGGKLAAEMAGALPESALRQLVDKAVPGMAPSTLNPRQLEQALKEGAVIAVDLRPAADFERRRIPGSVCAPADPEALDAFSLPDAVNADPRPVVFLCRSGKLSEALARRIHRERAAGAGYLGGGILEWEVSGRKLE